MMSLVLYLSPCACGEPQDEVVVPLGQLALDPIAEGIVVTLQGASGIVTVPFDPPLPELENSGFQNEMQRSVSLLVSSEGSGASADLGAGILVSGEPAAPGEFRWSLNAMRDSATLTFFNETPGGLTLTPGHRYHALLAITANPYIERVSAVVLPIVVEDG